VELEHLTGGTRGLGEEGPLEFMADGVDFIGMLDESGFLGDWQLAQLFEVFELVWPKPVPCKESGVVR
jgi:hypothetical protein